MAKTLKKKTKKTTRTKPTPKPKARALRKAVPPPDNPLLRQQSRDAALPGVDLKALAVARQQALKRR